MREFKNEDFAVFSVNFHFMRALAMHSKPTHTVRGMIDADHAIRRPVWELELPAPLKQKHGVESVFVVNFQNKKFQCWAGSTINDEEVFEFIRSVV
jgi:hypothetical protein